MTDEKTILIEDDPLLNKRCAVYLPQGTWFGHLVQATNKDLTFKSESGETRCYPRGKYDVREAKDRPR